MGDLRTDLLLRQDKTSERMTVFGQDTLSAESLKVSVLLGIIVFDIWESLLLKPAAAEPNSPDRVRRACSVKHLDARSVTLRWLQAVYQSPFRLTTHPRLQPRAT